MYFLTKNLKEVPLKWKSAGSGLRNTGLLIRIGFAVVDALFPLHTLKFLYKCYWFTFYVGLS